jgi:hypothetical protein
MFFVHDLCYNDLCYNDLYYNTEHEFDASSDVSFSSGFD